MVGIQDFYGGGGE